MDQIKATIFRLKDKVVSIVVIALLLVFCGFLLSRIIDLRKTLAEMESKQVQIDSIREELREISKYTVYEYNYTAIIHFSDSNTFKGFRIPLTGNNFIATIDGKMDIGINAELVEMEEKTDVEGNILQVVLSVPYSEIMDNHTIQESLEIYDEKNNIFNPVRVTDYKELIIEAEEKEGRKVQDGDILHQSDERVKYLLTAYLQKVYGEEVEIKVVYLENAK